uniref:Uncharacterized protein n=1 Tax=Lactuca sativa TaxID=4236 RepID=A0A9R1WVE9_LACSA|nr:hypothetical protein LSAT_V11C800427400 [Lactuca sativa]
MLGFTGARFWEDPFCEEFRSAEDPQRSDLFLPRNYDDLNQKADLTLKGVVGTIIKDYFLRLTQSQRLLFKASPFGKFLGIHIPHGDPLLVHLMMLYEVKSQQIQGMQLDFSEIEYILICGLKVGPYVDLLQDEKGRSNSNLCARLFPDISDARLRLKDLEDYIISVNYLSLQDENVVILIHLVYMLKGLHRRDVKTGIPAALYKLSDNIDDWNRFACGTYLWTYTSGLMRGILFKQTNLEFKKVHKYTVPGFMIPFKIWILETFPEATQFYIRMPAELPRMRSWRSKTPLSWVQCGRIINISVCLAHRKTADERKVDDIPSRTQFATRKIIFFRNVANGVGGCPKWKDVDMLCSNENIFEIENIF